MPAAFTPAKSAAARIASVKSTPAARPVLAGARQRGIGKPGIVEHCLGEIDRSSSGIGEIGAGQIEFGKGRALEARAGKTRAADRRFAEIGAAQIGAREIGLGQVAFAQIGAGEVGAYEARLAQNRTGQGRIVQIGAGEIDLGQIEAAETGLGEALTAAERHCDALGRPSRLADRPAQDLAGLAHQFAEPPVGLFEALLQLRPPGRIPLLQCGYPLLQCCHRILLSKAGTAGREIHARSSQHAVSRLAQRGDQRSRLGDARVGGLAGLINPGALGRHLRIARARLRTAHRHKLGAMGVNLGASLKWFERRADRRDLAHPRRANADDTAPEQHEPLCREIDPHGVEPGPNLLKAFLFVLRRPARRTFARRPPAAGCDTAHARDVNSRRPAPRRRGKTETAGRPARR